VIQANVRSQQRGGFKGEEYIGVSKSAFTLVNGYLQAPSEVLKNIEYT